MTNDKGRVVLGGATGLIGVPLADAFAARGYEVTLLVRHASETPRHREVLWEGQGSGPWARELDGARAVLNLAGFSVNCKWTPEHRELILSSRVDSTRAIATAVSTAADPPPVWVNASAIGFYGDRGNEVLDESSSLGTGFLADVCRDWEAALFDRPLRGVRRVAVRTGFVLAKEGGAFPILRNLARFGLGGPAGSGLQWYSPVAMDDLVEMYVWAVEGGIEGPVNAVMPKPERNRDFMMVLRERLRMPFGLPAPAFAIRLLGQTLGPDASLALGSTRVLPTKASEAGFRFAHETIDSAFASLFG